METTVVNVKVAHIRPRYQNLKEWCENPNNVYIGRKGIVFINKERYPKQDSIWANPFKIDKNLTRENVLNLYENYIVEKINKENLFEELLKLKGCCLGCWCHPEPCHGDILKNLINKIDK